MCIPLLFSVMDLVLPCSISPTGPSPLLRARLYGPPLPVWCAGELAPPETRAWEKKGPAVWAGSSEEVEQREREGRREESDLGVPWEWTSWLLCFLIPLSTEQQGGWEKRRSKRGRRMMRVKESCFHTRGEQAGGLRECVCVHPYTSVVLYLGLRSQRRCLKWR